ncbi:MAG TPA: right-handed parallel beta-helix repeat-containing protein, partial [Bacteroidota bacterium]|nr:right-handed parallel beta-helix repeat-containing protein [Bacteroidota bacterium]
CAVVIEGGTHNGVHSCDLENLALGAVRLSGGNRATLEPAGNYCTDNHLHHFSCWLRTGQYGVFLTGVGNRVAHNLIHDAPFEAIYLSGNDHTVEFNEIHHVTQETGDAGALHTGRDWTWRGNRIWNNYFHHLQGAGLHGVMGVYLDDWASGFSVKGNVFYKAGRATLIGGGRDNVVENNLYIECAPSVHIDARGLSWAGYYFDGTNPDLFKKMDAMNFSKPPYSIRYPELQRLYADEPRLPKHNRIERNISYGGRWMDVYDYRAFDLTLIRIRNNVIADTAVMRRRKAGEAGWDPYYLNIDTKEGYELLCAGDSSIRRELKGNLLVGGDPGFVDLTRGDFRLKPHALALTTGFRPIDMKKIGLLRKR